MKELYKFKNVRLENVRQEADLLSKFHMFTLAFTSRDAPILYDKTELPFDKIVDIIIVCGEESK